MARKTDGFKPRPAQKNEENRADRGGSQGNESDKPNYPGNKVNVGAQSLQGEREGEPKLELPRPKDTLASPARSQIHEQRGGRHGPIPFRKNQGQKEQTVHRKR